MAKEKGLKFLSRGSIDMTEGSPLLLILRFAVPLLIGNFLQQTYNIVDTVVVGRYIGKEALGAVGATGTLVFLFISLFAGLSIGGTVVIAQFFGAKNVDRVQIAVESIYKTYIVITLLLTTASVFFIDDFMALIGVPSDIIGLARDYLRIIFIGFFALFGYNINNAILQGLGDTVSNLIYLAIAVVINIVLDILFVGYMDMGVEGAAIATVIANTSAFVFGIWHINRSASGVRVRVFNKNYDFEIIKDVFRLGIPAGVQNILFSLGMMAVMRLVNSYGTDFVAGYNAAIKIDGIAFLPLTSYASAITAYVGQNVGAGKLDRVKHGVRQAIYINLVTGVILSAVVVLLGPHLLNLFLDEYDAGVINAGMAYIYRIVPFLWFLGILFILNCALRGAGSSVVPMLITLLSLVLGRVPLAYLLAHFAGRDNIFFAWPLGWLIGVAIVAPIYIRGGWKRKAERIHLEKMRAIDKA